MTAFLQNTVTRAGSARPARNAEATATKQDDGAVTWGSVYCSIAVVLRFGTNPTGIRATSFISLMSTTDTSLVTGLAT